MKAAILGGFSELVAMSGGDAFRLAPQAGIPDRALRDPDLVIPWTAVGDLLELTAHELRKPSLGLEWLQASPAPVLNFGAVVLIARFTSTVGEWCYHARDYWHWHTNASRADLIETEGKGALTLRLRFSKLVPPSRHQVEYIMGGVCLLLNQLTRGADGIEIVRFRHARPADTRLHDQIFPSPVEFGAAHDEIVYRRDLHERSVDLPQEAVQAWLTGYAESRLGELPDSSGTTRARVEAAISGLMGTDFCTQPHIAQLLRLGPKTLQRQLAREGTGFLELHNNVRERIGRQLLAETNISAKAIAGILGYTNPPALTAAVHRWTGTSARVYRNRHHGPAQLRQADQA